MNLRYITGDATRPQGEGPKIIVHICNDTGGWGRGFVVALSTRWRKPEQEYRKWYASGDDFQLGNVQFVEVEPDIVVANIIGQHKIKSAGTTPPIRYEAVQAGLQQVAGYAAQRQASVHMPRIGAGLAGGKWETIEAIIREELIRKGVSVTVYDLA